MRTSLFLPVLLAALSCGPPTGDQPPPDPQTARPQDTLEIQTETGALAGLEGTAWRLEDLGGRGVVDRGESMVAFDVDGTVYGSGGCNRFQGTYERQGYDLSFGPLAATRMACPEAVMEQEMAWLGFLESVVRYEHTAEGLLLLHADDGAPPARLSPVELAGS